MVFFLLSCLCLGFLTFNALNLRHSCSLSVFLNNSLHLLGFWFRFFFLGDGASPFHEKTTSSASTRPLNWDCRSFRFFSSFGFLHDRGLFTMAISTSHHLVEVIILVCFVRFSLGPGSSNGWPSLRQGCLFRRSFYFWLGCTPRSVKVKSFIRIRTVTAITLIDSKLARSSHSCRSVNFFLVIQSWFSNRSICNHLASLALYCRRSLSWAGCLFTLNLFRLSHRGGSSCRIFLSALHHDVSAPSSRLSWF